MESKLKCGVVLSLFAVACGAAPEATDDVANVEQPLVSFPTANTRPGVFRADGRFELDSNGSGTRNAGDAVRPFLGSRGPDDLPVVGTWGAHTCGQESTQIGIFRRNESKFLLDTNSTGSFEVGQDRTIFVLFFLSGLQPFAWVMQSGTTCTTVVGVMENATGGAENRWWVDLNNDGQIALTEKIGSFGGAGDKAAAIKSPTSSRSIMAVFRPSAAQWYIDNNGTNGWNGTPGDRISNFGIGTSKLVTNASQPFIGTSDGTRVFVDLQIDGDADPNDFGGNDLMVNYTIGANENPVIGKW